MCQATSKYIKTNIYRKNKFKFLFDINLKELWVSVSVTMKQK